MILTKVKFLKAVRRAKEGSYNSKSYLSTIDEAAKTIAEHPEWKKTLASSLKIMRGRGWTIEMPEKGEQDGE